MKQPKGFRTADRFYPSSDPILSQLRRLLYLNHDYWTSDAQEANKKAVEKYKRAISIDPNCITAYFNQAVTYDLPDKDKSQALEYDSIDN